MTISVSELFEAISIMKGEESENKETEKPERSEGTLHKYILKAKIYGIPKRDGIATIGMIASSFEEAISIFRRDIKNKDLHYLFELLSVTKDRQARANSYVGIYSISYN